MSECKSDIEVLKTETPYFPSISMKALFDNPAISAACPAESFASSYNFDATIIEKSQSFKSR